MADPTVFDAIPMLYSVRAQRVGGLIVAYVFDRNSAPIASIQQTFDRGWWRIVEGGKEAHGKRFGSLAAAITAVCHEVGLTVVVG